MVLNVKVLFDLHQNQPYISISSILLNLILSSS
ncbi:unnamed protein product, partial [Vitis vinifera]|uniref:Uncharacterized protein n=1 Tax=Vitis vinifera TaxID=29760 RepID=D7U0Y1_VITVI